MALGGYDAYFIQPLIDQHTCPICHLALRDPKLTHCGHQFCDDCLRPLNRNGKLSCPTCRTELELAEIYPNNMLKREILSLKIRCDEQEVGCQWRGELRHQEQHMASCVYVSELCDNQCGETMMRKDMERHKEESCCKRIVVCAFCYEQMEYSAVDEHTEQCASCPIMCIHQCGAMVPRGEMTAHTGKDGLCPKSHLHCEFEHMGCRFKGNRTQLEVHLTHNAASHLTMVTTSLHSRLELAENKLITAENKVTAVEKQEAATAEKLKATEMRLAAAEEKLLNSETQRSEMELQHTATRRQLADMKSRLETLESHQHRSMPLKGAVATGNKRPVFETEPTVERPLARKSEKPPCQSHDLESVDYLRKLLAKDTEACVEEFGVCHYVWNLKHWSEQLKDAKKRPSGITSEAFYTNIPGYCLTVDVFLNGCRDYKGTHMSLGVCQVEGNRYWQSSSPQRCTMSLSLLSQRAGMPHKVVSHKAKIEPLQRGRYFLCADFITHHELRTGGFIDNNEIFIKLQFQLV